MTTPTKDQEQIERDKAAVNKMIGAKGAMEGTLRYINHLEDAIKRMQSAHNDCMKAASMNAHVRCYRNEKGAYSHDAKLVKVEAIHSEFHDIAARALRDKS